MRTDFPNLGLLLSTVLITGSYWFGLLRNHDSMLKEDVPADSTRVYILLSNAGPLPL